MSQVRARPGMSLYEPSSCPTSPSKMRLVIRAELRSVTWAGSMVTGSARSPITMASLGGAAPAPEARATASITRDSVAIRRIVMVGSFGPQSCLNQFDGATIPSPPEGERVRVRGSSVALEDQVAAVDDKGVAGVVAGGVAGEVDGDAAEVVAHAPAAQRNAGQHLLHEGLAVERLLGHGRVDPPRDDGVDADLMARQLHRHRARHGHEGALGRGVVLAPRRAHHAGQARRAHERSTTAALDHVFGRRTEREEGAVQIDGHHAPPLLRGHLVKAFASAPAAAHARIGEEGIHASHGLDRLRKATVHRGFVAHVAADGHGLAPVPLQLLERRVVLRLVCAPDADGGAGLCHRLRHAEADAAVATGDQRHLVGEIESLVRHGCPFALRIAQPASHRPAARICDGSYGGSVRRMSRSTPMRASAARFSESARSQAEARPAKTLRLKREGSRPAAWCSSRAMRPTSVSWGWRACVLKPSPYLPAMAAMRGPKPPITMGGAGSQRR